MSLRPDVAPGEKQRSSEEFLELDSAHVTGKPYGRIRHQDTDLCIDLHCACGANLHYDGDYLYKWLCPHCKRCYVTGWHLAMWEMTEAEIAAEKLNYSGVIKVVDKDL